VNARRQSPALIGSVLLHGAVAAALLFAWPWSRDLKIGSAVPVTIVTNAPPAELAPAIQAPEPQTAQTEPLSVSIRADGSLFVQEEPTPFSSLAPRLKEMSSGDTRKPIYVRADGKASYAVVAQVMAALSTSGFTSINLSTDTGGPSSGSGASGDKPAPEQAAAP
jgi:biopolymer transport protein TolR